MKLAILFVLPALAAARFKPNTCRMVDVIPFFNEDAHGRSTSNDEDLSVLTEFARFMNHKVPQMLEEFAHLKNILNVGRSSFDEDKDQTVANLRMPKNLKLDNEIRAMFDMAEEITNAQVQSKFFFPNKEETEEWKKWKKLRNQAKSKTQSS